MTYFLLLVWICHGPGACAWELRGQFRDPEACHAAMKSQDRYSQCLEISVPVPGTPSR